MILNMTVKGKLIQTGKEEIMCKIVGELKDIFIGYFECIYHNGNNFWSSYTVLQHIRKLGDWLKKRTSQFISFVFSLLFSEGKYSLISFF